MGTTGLLHRAAEMGGVMIRTLSGTHEGGLSIRRTLALVIAVAMLVMVSPVSAFAVDPINPPTVIEITNSQELAMAIENQEPNQIWELSSGTFDVPRNTSINLGNQTGWYFPIYEPGITVRGAGQGDTVITSSVESPNGAWASQDLISVWSDRVTIENLTIVSKIEANKAIEVMAADFTARNVAVVKNDASPERFAGSIFFNPTNDGKSIGNALLDGVTVSQGFISNSPTRITEGTLTLRNTVVDYRDCDASSVWGAGFAPIRNYNGTIVDNFVIKIDNEVYDLQPAILATAPEGTVVELDAGEYVTTPGAVSNGIMLRGMGSEEASVVVKPLADTVNSAAADGPLGLALIDAQGDLGLENLTVDGGGYLVNAGVRVKGAGAFEDVTVTKCARSNTVGFGIIAQGGGTYNNVSVSKVGRIGMYVMNANSSDRQTALIDYYNFVGAGVGAGIDYGIEIGRGGSAMIDHSIISGAEEVSGQWNSSAVIVTAYRPGNVDVQIANSDFSQNDHGIMAGYSDTDAGIASVAVHGTKLPDLIVSGNRVNTIQAENNYWGGSAPVVDRYPSADEVNVVVTPYYLDEAMTQSSDLLGSAPVPVPTTGGASTEIVIPSAGSGGGSLTIPFETSEDYEANGLVDPEGDPVAIDTVEMTYSQEPIVSDEAALPNYNSAPLQITIEPKTADGDKITELVAGYLTFTIPYPAGANADNMKLMYKHAGVWSQVAKGADEGAGFYWMPIEDNDVSFKFVTSKFSELAAFVAIPVESIVLDSTEAVLPAGATYEIVPTVAPADALNKELVWSSTDDGVASVMNGVVTAVAPGSATITVESTDGSDIAAEFVVVVTKPAVVGLQLSIEERNALVGATFDIEATLNPEDNRNPEVIWYSTNTSVATVDSTGKVTVVGAGVAKIVAQSLDNAAVKAECILTASPVVESITMNMTSRLLRPTYATRLRATVLPEGSNQAVLWTSSDPSVVRVSMYGLIRALKPGAAVITATSAENGEVIGQTKVTVPVLVTSIKLSKTKLYLKYGYQLTAVVGPKNATNKALVWKDNYSKVKVSSTGKITILKGARKGKVVRVSAIAKDHSGIKATCIVVIR